VLVLAVTYQVTVPLPVKLDGEQVSHPGALLTGDHEQLLPVVTVNVPLPDAAPG